MNLLNSEDKKWVDEVWQRLDNKLAGVAERSKNKIPYTTKNGVHDNKAENDVAWWTNGFFAGLMWLMYAGTKNDVYKITAENNELMLDEALKNYEGLHHDVGFMWLISSGASYRLTGNKESRIRTAYAANVLAARYNLNGKFIRAWNDWGDEAKHIGWAIIDCMMNIPLLYWASREFNDDRFKYIAMSHADTTMENHIRKDGSTRHIVVYDHINGGFLDEIGGQGFEVGSSWSRGQAWGLYGFTLSYIHTKKPEYLDTAKRIAHYFISSVCDDWLPKCDFRAPAEPVIYDSTAGAIAACGLLEIANNVGEHEKHIYFNAALNILKNMEKEFCNWEDSEDSILQKGTEQYHDEKTRHIPIIYGDYYFAEAIYKLKGFDILFW